MNALIPTTTIVLITAVASGPAYATPTAGAQRGSGSLLSATYGADNFPGIGPCAGQIVDGVPVVFDRPLAPNSVDASDFVIITATGRRVQPLCATFFPSINADEGQTILTQGIFGDPNASPRAVEIVGRIRAADGSVTYRGESISVVPWEVGAVLVYARRLPLAQAVGGFDQCPNGTAQVVQLAFGSNAGNDFPTTADYLGRFTVTLENGASVHPVNFGDVTVDNYLELCLSDSSPAVSVEIEAETIPDASTQLNEAPLSAPVD